MIYNIPVAPTAKGRPRVVSIRGLSRTYTPDKTVDAEERIKWHLRAQNAKLEHGPVVMEVYFHVHRPKKVTKSGWPTTRPDLENYVKLVMDACIGITYDDDSQVVEIRAKKVYAESEPCIILEITEKM